MNELTFFPVLSDDNEDSEKDLTRVERQGGLGRLDVISHMKALTSALSLFQFQEMTSSSNFDHIEPLLTKHEDHMNNQEKVKQENVFSFAAKWFNFSG